MQVIGTQLSESARRAALARFVHRFTVNNRPQWARANPNYLPQFLDDSDWLANTRFHVTKSGQLDRRYSHCESTPTWPQGKGVWGRKGVDW